MSSVWDKMQDVFLQQLYKGSKNPDRALAQSPINREQFSARKDPDLPQKVAMLFANQQERANDLAKVAEDYGNQEQKINLAPALALVDSWTGSNLSSAYNKPVSPEERKMNLAKLRQLAGKAQDDVTENQIKLLRGDDQDYLKLLLADARQNQNSDKSERDKKKMLNNWRRELGDRLNTYKQRATQLGVISGTTVQANKLITLMDRYENGNELTDIEMRELATGVAGLLSRQNQVAQEQVEALDPRAASKTLAQLIQWFTSDPQGAGLGNWVKRYAKTLQAEQQTADAELNELRKRMLTQSQALWEEDPQSLLNIANAWGVRPEQVYDAFAPMEKKQNKEYKELPAQTNEKGIYSQTVKNSGKKLTKAQVQAAAQRDGVTYEQAAQKLTKELGFTIE